MMNSFELRQRVARGKQGGDNFAGTTPVASLCEWRCGDFVVRGVRGVRSGGCRPTDDVAINVMTLSENFGALT